MSEIKPRSIRVLVRQGLQHYPNSKHMRRQWVQKTYALEASGRHARLTGGYIPDGLQSEVRDNG